MKNALIRILLTVGIVTAIGAVPCYAESVPQKKEEQKKSGIASGTVEQIDKKAGTVMLRLVLVSKMFKLAPDCEFVLGKRSKASLDDLKVGDEVTINYEEE